MKNLDFNHFTKMLEIRAFEESICEHIESGENEHHVICVSDKKLFPLA